MVLGRSRASHGFAVHPDKEPVEAAETGDPGADGRGRCLSARSAHAMGPGKHMGRGDLLGWADPLEERPEHPGV